MATDATAADALQAAREAATWVLHWCDTLLRIAHGRNPRGCNPCDPLVYAERAAKAITEERLTGTRFQAIDAATPLLPVRQDPVQVSSASGENYHLAVCSLARKVDLVLMSVPMKWRVTQWAENRDDYERKEATFADWWPYAAAELAEEMPLFDFDFIEVALKLEAPSTPDSPPRPRWDKGNKTLWIGDKIVRTYKQVAPAQWLVLDGFQEQDWPARQDNLFTGGGADPHEQLQNAVKQLNKQSGPGHIQFQLDGTGTGVTWAPKTQE